MLEPLRDPFVVGAMALAVLTLALFRLQWRNFQKGVTLRRWSRRNKSSRRQASSRHGLARTTDGFGAGEGRSAMGGKARLGWALSLVAIGAILAILAGRTGFSQTWIFVAVGALATWAALLLRRLNGPE